MEVMKVATDAILKVKDAELKAKEIIEKANQEIVLLKEESREQIKKFQKDAIETAIKDAEILKTKYKTEGEAIASPIFKEAEQKVLAIKDVKEDKLESVIELIVERIVNSNGNS
jgi:V-type sodium ATPase, G subunit